MKVSYALAPALRFLPPWWRWRIYSRICRNPYSSAGFEGKVARQRIAPHGFEVELALENWMERFCYFTKGYYDPTTISVFERFVRPNDWFIDVGANVGLVSLTAAKLVGSGGRVLAFEPNVVLVDRLRSSLVRNDIRNVEVIPVALGEENTSAHLATSSQHGTGTLREGIGSEVTVRKGDDLLPQIPADIWVFVKLDVEGYELRALRGMQSLLRRPKTGFYVEITGEWLNQLGGSADELISLLQAHGYEGVKPAVDYLSRLRFVRKPLPLPLHQYDIFFHRPADNLWSR